jgi:hypothetical protein
MSSHHPPALPASDPPRASYDDPLTDVQKAWLAALCATAARSTASAIARDFIRLGRAHEWLLIAHMDELLQHRTRAQLERLIEASLDALCERE